MKDIKDFKIKSMVINIKRALIPLSQSKVFKKFDITTTSHMPEFIQCIFVCYWVKVRVHIVYGLHHRNFYWISDKVKIGSLSTCMSIPSVQNTELLHFFFFKYAGIQSRSREGKIEKSKISLLKTNLFTKILNWFDASSY